MGLPERTPLGTPTIAGYDSIEVCDPHGSARKSLLPPDYDTDPKPAVQCLLLK